MHFNYSSSHARQFCLFLHEICPTPALWVWGVSVFIVNQMEKNIKTINRYIWSYFWLNIFLKEVKLALRLWGRIHSQISNQYH